MADTPNETVRLNKFLASCGVASRRGADDLVAAGRVRVNGGPAESGMRIDPDNDQVVVDGRAVRLPQAAPRVFALHKPVQVVTTASDPQGRKTVLELLPKDIRALRPFPVGRLDFFSEGLLLLTTDGELCNRLTHPSHHLPKVYRVQVKEQVPEAALAAMRRGMTLAEGEKLAPVQVQAATGFRNSTILTMTLIQGVNRQIRRMCRDFGLTIVQLKRVGQGPIQLGDLPVGAYREITGKELQDLRRAAGLG
jgi:23S rRNA pseudouridine2605 synthase